MSQRRTFRCAVYTRKSTEEGLDQDFNSLDAQREACEAYIRSQKHEGWISIRDRFDDGGYSGGSMERPALHALLAAIRDRRIDTVVVYKIDRLTRSLADFSRIVEVFDTHRVSFVSVTQAFNTTTSMGRLTLNVLLSFAQFEREVTAERIRDKIAASRRKGMWMGGRCPLGYDVRNGDLEVNEAEAETVRILFHLYLDAGSVRELQQRAAELGLTTKHRRSRAGRESGGGAFSRGHLYAVLANPTYVGRVIHRGETHPGRQAPIVGEAVWEAVQAKLTAGRPGSGYVRSGSEISLLTGLVFDETGDRLSPSHAIKAGRRYRYYVSRRLARDPNAGDGGWRLPARELERAVIVALTGYLRDGGRLIATLRLSADQSPDRLRSLLHRSQALAEEIDAMAPPVARTVLQQIIHRIDLAPERLQLLISRMELISILLGASIAQPESNDREGEGVAAVPKNIPVAVPMALRRRGIEAKLVLRGPTDPGETATLDPILVAIVRKAHQALALLVSGRSSSVEGAASRLKLASSDLTRFLPLAFLAPDITTAILDGRHPPSLTVTRLRSLSPVPADWTVQRQVLGFPEPTGI